MQQHKHFWQKGRLQSHQPLLLALLSAGALLALLVVAGWGTALAAPASAGSPLLSIVNSSGSTVTLEFDFWTLNQPLTLSYVQGTDCAAGTPLPNPDFEVSAAHFQHDYTLPGDIPQGTYHLCASDSLDGTIVSTNALFITNTGTIELTPPVPTSTPTNSSASGTPTPHQTSTPGNQGATANGSHNAGDAGGNTLVAIILLCLLVLALLAYLIRLWLLQGRRSTPGGGQKTP